MIPDMQRMYELMRKKTKNYVLYKKEIKDAQHNEAQWRAAFPTFYQKWLGFMGKS
jgi:hypothetical protein